jgi:hypothetical protein
MGGKTYPTVVSKTLRELDEVSHWSGASGGAAFGRNEAEQCLRIAGAAPA